MKISRNLISKARLGDQLDQLFTIEQAEQPNPALVVKRQTAINAYNKTLEGRYA